MHPYSRSASFHHGIKAIILLGFAAYIANLVHSERIILYIAPRMVDYVKWSAVALYAVALHQAYAAIQAWRAPHKTVDCDCGHDHTPSGSLLKNIIVYGLFMLPLLLGFLLPDAALSSSLADKKGMNLNSSSSIKGKVPSNAGDIHGGKSGTGTGSTDSVEPPAASTGSSLDALFPADSSSKAYAELAKKLYQTDLITVKEDLYMETLSAVDLYLDRFVGKKLQLTGFVYKQEAMNANQFVIGRFSIQCCSADAAPFGVMVDYPGAKALEKDSWVTATGTIGKAKYNDTEIMVLKVEKVIKANPAKSPYVYPNAHFGS